MGPRKRRSDFGEPWDEVCGGLVQDCGRGQEQASVSSHLYGNSHQTLH